jgi:hypothetical protein
VLFCFVQIEIILLIVFLTILILHAICLQVIHQKSRISYDEITNDLCPVCLSFPPFFLLSLSQHARTHTLELTKYQSCWRVGDGKIQRGNFLQNLDGNRHIVWHHVNNELEFAKYHTRWRVSDGSKIQWGNFLKNLGGSGCIVWQLVNNEARIKLYQTFRTDVGVAAASCDRCCAIRYIMW